jgi:hypothetical protein
MSVRIRGVYILRRQAAAVALVLKAHWMVDGGDAPPLVGGAGD